jgi:DNA-binding MarR family transcriptional regulator
LLGFKLWLASDLLTEQFARHVNPSISRGMSRLCALLYEADGQTISQLAERSFLAQPTVTRAVAKLAQSGYVSRGETEADKRQVVVYLTAEGRAFTEQIYELARDLQAQDLADQSADDLASLHKVLDALIARLLREHQPGGRL